MTEPKIIGGLLKVDPETGLTDEQIAAIYKALGIEPKPATTPPATE